MAFSKAEADYCELTVKNGLRLDGRGWDEYRTVEVELGIIAMASGSARVHVGGTDVVVGVKAEVGPPRSSHPNSGRLAVTVECSPCASPEYEGRGGERWGHSLAEALVNSLAPPGPSGKAGGVDLTPLCIVPGKAAWTLFVDCLVLNDDGGVLSALSMACLAALASARLPRVTVSKNHKSGTEGEAMDGLEGDGLDSDDPEIELDDDEGGGGGLPLSGLDSVPVVVSLGLIGGQFLVDPGLLEEKAARSTMHIAVDRAGKLSGVSQEGPGAIDPLSLEAAIEGATSIGPVLISKMNLFTSAGR